MARNVNDLYVDILHRLRYAPTHSTRNGKVKCLEEPSVWNIREPDERVLLNDERQANPYFHVMETVWMFSGSNRADWLEPFNGNIMNYANDGIINGAYGNRWTQHFGINQIENAIDELRLHPNSRQAVIAMYDPTVDYLPEWRDRPCNTHLYFRVLNDKLEMTVCNRSNDAVWGLLGANIVHMTYLQEYIAFALSMEMGNYYVMTNNLHVYEPHWHLLESPVNDSALTPNDIKPSPLLKGGENRHQLIAECKDFVNGGDIADAECSWMKGVVQPMYEHYTCRAMGDTSTYDINETEASDWREAERRWKGWKGDE